MTIQKLTAIDLFSGAGGLGLGITQAGFQVVLANEIMPDFAASYRHNHPNTTMINQDIHLVDFKSTLLNLGYQVGEIDLVCGGPPCQGFSTIGAKKETDDRNSLFYEFLRAIAEIQPKFVIFENVAGFKRLYDGKAYHALIQELAGLGYASHAGILEASDFGLPQNRQRMILIAWRKTLAEVKLPQASHHQTQNLFSEPIKLSLMEAISDLPPLEANSSATDYLSPPQNAYQLSLRAGMEKLTEHNASNYGEKMQQILSIIPEGGSVFDLPLALRPKSFFNNTYARLLPNQPAPTITRNFGTPSSSRCIHPFQNRALSTREGARLQGFPDNYVFIGSKTSKNLQIGNAVPPIFGKIIATQIIQSLSTAISTDQLTTT